MFLKIRLPSSILALCLCIVVAECLPWFQTFIPNGDNVPNPCTEEDQGDIWERVGHKNRLMEMDKNPQNTTNQFGLVSRPIYSLL